MENNRSLGMVGALNEIDGIVGGAEVVTAMRV